MEKLECKDFELEFLKVFGIELIDDKFINTKTDKEFIFFFSSEKIHRSGLIQQEYKFCCDDLEIEFYRNNKLLNYDGYRVSVNVGHNYKYYTCQNYFDDQDLIRGRCVGIRDYKFDEYDKNNPNTDDRRFYDDHFSIIDFSQEFSSDYLSVTSFYTDKPSKYSSNYSKSQTICSLSAIYADAQLEKWLYNGSDDVVSYDRKEELSIENYRQVLIDNIKRIYEGDTIAIDFYLSMVDYLVEAFVSQLKRPFKHQEWFSKRLENRREMIRKTYQGEEQEQKLAEVEEMEKALYNYYPSLEINCAANSSHQAKV